MDIKKLSPSFSVSPQIEEDDVTQIADLGFQGVINNRPEGEAAGQPDGPVIEAQARRLGLGYRHIPVVSGQITDADVEAFKAALDEMNGPILAFCRSGARSASLWGLAHAGRLSPDAIIETAATAGYDLSGLRGRLQAQWEGAGAAPAARGVSPTATHDVVIVGGGAAGIAAAASLLRRRPTLDVAIIEPSDRHSYQPGWTLVGAGVMKSEVTFRRTADLIPRNAKWIHAAAAAFEPDADCVILEDGQRIGYRTLIAAPGLALDWDAVEGARETLGRNGVTSNYEPGLAPYTWRLVQDLKSGRALFTQPPMPIKCAGAPQKAMYLSCDWWLKHRVLKDIAVEFHTACDVLFGVADFVPPLMRYVRRYGADLRFKSNLVKVDGPARRAWFDEAGPDGQIERVEKSFDLLHMSPPQRAPRFVAESPLANAAGWVDVHRETLQHVRHRNVFAVGDVASAPNEKTAAAVRKQAPIVAENVLAVLDGRALEAVYDGYGSCPLTVERGRVVMAEFGYGGKLTPTFPLDPTVPRWTMWIAKARLMPYLYFDLMLKGHEWLAKPRLRRAGAESGAAQARGA